jgi:hypothetical protein
VFSYLYSGNEDDLPTENFKSLILKFIRKELEKLWTNKPEDWRRESMERLVQHMCEGPQSGPELQPRTQVRIQVKKFVPREESKQFYFCCLAIVFIHKSKEVPLYAPIHEAGLLQLIAQYKPEHPLKRNWKAEIDELGLQKLQIALSLIQAFTYVFGCSLLKEAVLQIAQRAAGIQVMRRAPTSGSQSSQRRILDAMWFKVESDNQISQSTN